MKKSAAETYRLLIEAYTEVPLRERSSSDCFYKFKHSDFDVETQTSIWVTLRAILLRLKSLAHCPFRLPLVTIETHV